MIQTLAMIIPPSGERDRMSIRLMIVAFPAVLVLCAILHPTMAPAGGLACPGSIAVQENVTELPEGWFAHRGEVPQRLMKVGFFDGNPKEKAELAPEKETENKGKWRSVWSFDAKTAQDLWISCSYGRTAMTLAQPLKKPYKSCSVVSDTTVTIDGQPSVVSVECQ